jgi:nitrous oxidase accessory protein
MRGIEFFWPICLIGFWVAFDTQAKTLTVGQNKAFKTISLALSSAVHGDTVLVDGGFYKEGNLVIDKKIIFLGKNMPTIDGDRKFEVLTIKADSVQVIGFKIQHSGYATLDDPGGIKIINSSGVLISQNILFDNFFGVYVQFSKNCIIKNNRIIAFGKEEQQIGNGVHCWKSDSLQIIANHISGHRDGIYFEFVTHSVIWRNVSQANIRYGLHFMFSNNDAYFCNLFKNNGAGVAVMFTKNVTMMNNSFQYNWGDAAYGLLLKEISDSYVGSNRFSHNTMGVFMEGTNRITMERNEFLSNGWAMKIQASCMDNLIRQNNFMANTFDVGTNGTTVLNVFESNYWDKYQGYDLNKDGRGDIPYRPLSMFSVIIERNPAAMLLYRSLMVTLLDKSEKIFPTLTPDNFIDNSPKMKAASRW